MAGPNILNFGNKVVFISGLPLTLPVASTDPVSGTSGDMYYNTTSNIVRFYNGTSWEDVGSSAYTFSDSLVNASGNVTLVNDNPTPGNTQYYGTNSGGTLGYYSLTFDALSPMTTTGDTIYEASPGSAARLAIGTPGQVLAVASGIPAWTSVLEDTSSVTQLSWSTSGITIPNALDVGSTNQLQIDSSGDLTTSGHMAVGPGALLNQNASFATGIGSYIMSIYQQFTTQPAAGANTNVGIVEQTDLNGSGGSALSGEGGYFSLTNNASNTTTGNSGVAVRAVAINSSAVATGTLSGFNTTVTNSGTGLMTAGNGGIVTVNNSSGAGGITTVNAFQVNVNNTSSAVGSIGTANGLKINVINAANLNMTAQLGESISVLQNGTGSVPTQTALNLQSNQNGAGSITTNTLLLIQGISNAGTITTNTGVSIGDQGHSGITTSYNIKSNASNATYNIYASGTSSNYFQGAVVLGSSLQLGGALTSTGTLLIDVDNGSAALEVEASNFQRSTDGINFVIETYTDATVLTDNSTNPVGAFQFAAVSYAGEEITYVIENGASPSLTRIGVLRVVCNSDGSNPSIEDNFTETADVGVSWTATNSSGTISVSYTTTNQSSNRTMRSDMKQFRR